MEAKSPRTQLGGDFGTLVEISWLSSCLNSRCARSNEACISISFCMFGMMNRVSLLFKIVLLVEPFMTLSISNCLSFDGKLWVVDFFNLIDSRILFGLNIVLWKPFLWKLFRMTFLEFRPLCLVFLAVGAFESCCLGIFWIVEYLLKVVYEGKIP